MSKETRGVEYTRVDAVRDLLARALDAVEEEGEP
jgi:hypothetical protein